MLKDEKLFFEIFPWNKNFETGIAVIDEQHRKLVNILNRLAAHLANLASISTLNEVFDELADYADYHFKTEEVIWATYFKDDAWYTEHEQTHGSFIHEVIELKENREGRPFDEVIYEIVSFLSKWLAYHILDTDKTMAKAVLAIEKGSSIEEAKNISLQEMAGSMKQLIDTVLSMYNTLSSRTMDLMREKALRKRAEQELRLSKERWKFILDVGSEDIWEWNIDDLKDDQSERTIPDKDIFKNRLLDVSESTQIHPDDIEQIDIDLQEHLEGNTEYFTNKHRILSQDGSWRWVLSRGKVIDRDDKGEPLRIVGTHSDITERELASIIYQSSSQAMMITDRKNHIISINPAFTAITGYAKEEVMGKDPKILASGRYDRAHFKKLWDVLLSQGHWDGELWNKRKDGLDYAVQLSINSVLNQYGDIDHFVGLFSDITRKKEMEEKEKEHEETVIAQSRHAAMGEMISMIAHQWRQPLTVISMGANNILADIELGEADDASLIEHAMHINEQTQHLSKTIDDFRDFFRSEKAIEQVRLIDVADDARRIIGKSLENNGIRLTISAQSDRRIDTYRRELLQVYLNLLNNAKEALLEKRPEDPYIEVVITADKEHTLTTICDNAEGIDESMIEQVFEPYFTTKGKTSGAGLGLYISKTIVERHLYGKIFVRNTEVGCCFTIMVPLDRQGRSGRV